MSNDTPAPISDDEVVALTKSAIDQSREDINQRAVSDNPQARDLQQQQPGITIDLGHKNIVRLPDEVIDVIRAEIERCDALRAASPAYLPLSHARRLATLELPHARWTATDSKNTGSPSPTTSSRRCPRA